MDLELIAGVISEGFDNVTGDPALDSKSHELPSGAAPPEKAQVQPGPSTKSKEVSGEHSQSRVRYGFPSDEISLEASSSRFLKPKAASFGEVRHCPTTFLAGGQGNLERKTRQVIPRVASVHTPEIARWTGDFA